jgi:hypothetical protein
MNRPAEDRRPVTGAQPDLARPVQRVSIIQKSVLREPQHERSRSYRIQNAKPFSVRPEEPPSSGGVSKGCAGEDRLSLQRPPCFSPGIHARAVRQAMRHPIMRDSVRVLATQKIRARERQRPMNRWGRHTCSCGTFPTTPRGNARGCKVRHAHRAAGVALPVEGTRQINAILHAKNPFLDRQISHRTRSAHGSPR